MIGVDSSVLIDVFNRRNSSKKFDDYLSEGIVTSEIVVYEVMCGPYAMKRDVEKRFFEAAAVWDSFSAIFEVDRRASLRAAQIMGTLLKSGQQIEHTDVLIAGSLLANGCRQILTNNVKDFARIRDLEVIKW